MGRPQEDSVFVFDEPTIGLHPQDVRVLLDVFRTLLNQGATVVVIEHDLDVIRSADYIVDMGPGGGAEGGRIVVSGTPAQVRACPRSQGTVLRPRPAEMKKESQNRPRGPRNEKRAMEPSPWSPK